MSLETEFAAEIAKKYEQGGWVIASPDEAIQQINFRPDLLLKRGDEHLVIEIKKEGFIGSRATDTIRKLVEMDKKWKFEIKIIPKVWRLKTANVSQSDVDARFRIAENLQIDGYDSEAFILYWTIIEALMRCLLGIEASRDVGSSTLIREAYEEDIIVDAELRELQTALKIRNKIVHGVQAEITAEISKNIQDISNSLRIRFQPEMQIAL